MSNELAKRIKKSGLLNEPIQNLRHAALLRGVAPPKGFGRDKYQWAAVIVEHELERSNEEDGSGRGRLV